MDSPAVYPKIPAKKASAKTFDSLELELARQRRQEQLRRQKLAQLANDIENSTPPDNDANEFDPENSPENEWLGGEIGSYQPEEQPAAKKQPDRKSTDQPTDKQNPKNATDQPTTKTADLDPKTAEAKTAKKQTQKKPTVSDQNEASPSWVGNLQAAAAAKAEAPRISREKDQPKKSELTKDNQTKTSADPSSISGKLNSARQQAAKKAAQALPKITSGNLSGATEAASVATNLYSRYLLTVFWGSVWLDWTLLSLLYLNCHLAASVIAPKHVCEFGQDYLFGKWLPSDLAKWWEVILLFILDGFIITIIVLLIYVIYWIYQGLMNPFSTIWNMGLWNAAKFIYSTL